MTALRAQMNPHFIFNCLNSIKLYTLQNDTDKASDYLTKFSQLIRLVLENSRADRILLHHELAALRLYCDLEAMRFKNKVVVTIRIDPGIDQQSVSIPPLLLQPYVENAIWHGLMHKLEGGTVVVEVTQPTDEYLHIEVTDDGIGRVRAGILKSKSAGTGKSFGMQVTADRIRLINERYNTHTQASIFDLAAPNGEPLGTKVVLDIPI
ncbi:sensor histidine kinase [Spirosoma aerophilum]